MSDEDIDLDRVVIDPAYRRAVIDFLNGKETLAVAMLPVEPRAEAIRPS